MRRRRRRERGDATTIARALRGTSSRDGANNGERRNRSRATFARALAMIDVYDEKEIKGNFFCVE